MTERPKDRVRLVSKLISIASKLRAMNNFNGLMEILSGLNRGPVYRLKQTFTEIERTKEAQYRDWTELLYITSSERSYQCLRKELRTANPPCMPYLGIFI